MHVQRELLKIARELESFKKTAGVWYYAFEIDASDRLAGLDFRRDVLKQSHGPDVSQNNSLAAVAKDVFGWEIFSRSNLEYDEYEQDVPDRRGEHTTRGTGQLYPVYNTLKWSGQDSAVVFGNGNVEAKIVILKGPQHSAELLDECEPLSASEGQSVVKDLEELLEDDARDYSKESYDY